MFCGASAELEPREACLAMQGCNNCRVDIRLKGQWTGTGWRITQALVEKHGADAIYKADREAAELRNRKRA